MPRRQVWHTSSSGRRSISSCEGLTLADGRPEFEDCRPEIKHVRDSSRLHSWRRGGVHRQFRRAGLPQRHRAGTGRAVAQPGRRVPGRGQRRAQHRRAVSGCVLLQPAPDDCGSGGAGPADRQRLQRKGTRSAPRAHGVAAHLRRGSARGDPADRVPELEPLTLSRSRYLGHRQSGRLRLHRVAGALPGNGAAGRARRLVHNP